MFKYHRKLTEIGSSIPIFTAAPQPICRQGNAGSCWDCHKGVIVMAIVTFCPIEILLPAADLSKRTVSDRL